MKVSCNPIFGPKNSTKIILGEQQKQFDFTSIRDKFRQHIQSKKNYEKSELCLLDEELMGNLISLKQQSFELLMQFKNIHQSSKPSSDAKTFASFEQFLNFVVDQEEILNSELWKLEAIYRYILEISLNRGA